MNRYSKNPIIQRGDIPTVEPHLVDISSVFNPGAIKFNNTYLLLLRVQNRGRETLLLKATSSDGTAFDVDDKPVIFSGIESLSEKMYHLYDPRISKIGNVYYIVFALDTDKGCRLGIAQTEDFESYRFIGLVSDTDSRNGVLFPEMINGSYYLLERPNNVNDTGGGGGDQIWVSRSTDLHNWKRISPILSGRPHYWDELIGSGPPPVKTKYGWLHIFHGIATHFSSSNIYQAGVCLLDLTDPSKVIARGRYNILEPREMYEMTGQVPNVVFPTGMIAGPLDASGNATDDSEVKIYYGAADTSVCLVTTTVQDLIQHCYAGGADD